MPTDTKLDLHRGSVLTKSASGQGTRYDRARRVARVSGLSNANTDLSAAINAAIAEAGSNVHQSKSTLPLLYATAMKTGKERARVDLVYGMPPNGGGNTVTVDTIANVRVGYDLVEWWGDAASPGSVKTAYDPYLASPRAVATMVAVPVIHLELPVELASSPAANATVMGMVGKVNDGNFALGGKTWPANTLRFNGFMQTFVLIDGGAVHYVRYQYSARLANPDGSQGWVESYLTDLTDPPTPATRDMYVRTTFSAVPLT